MFQPIQAKALVACFAFEVAIGGRQSLTVAGRLELCSCSRMTAVVYRWLKYSFGGVQCVLELRFRQPHGLTTFL
jgi:hypothetical protein